MLKISVTDNTVIESRLYPVIEVDFDTVENRGGHGLDVVEIVVRKGDKVAKFYGRLKVSKNNRIYLETAVIDVGKPQDRKKSIFGSWFKKS